MKNNVKRLLSLLVAVLMVLSVSGSAFALTKTNGTPERENVAGVLESKTAASYDLSGMRNGKTFAISDKNVENDEIAADQIVPIMVELQDAPAMEVYSQYRAAKSYAESLRQKQDVAVKSIRNNLGVNVDVIYNYTLLFNGFSFNGEYRLVEELNKMDGIRAFVAAEWDIPEIQLFNSGDMVGAIDAWDLDYTGEGGAVAIIDTGMKVDHAAFSTAPENPRFEKSDIAALIASGDLQGSNMNADNVYYSAKIPFRWNYVKNNYNVNHAAVGSDHGTHVAGIAAGNGGEIVGVAKDAQLFAMNVFNDGGGAGWVAILKALEDCVVIGVDAANMSLGSPCGFTHYYDPSYATVFENLVNAGVNLAVSAGNEYSTALGNKWGGGGTNMGYVLPINADYGVTGSPSTWAQSLGVASIDNTKSQGYYIENLAIGEKFAYSETDYNQPKLAETFGGQTLDYIYIPGVGNPEDFEGYDVAGKVALIQRGDISFYVKIENAQAVGAIAVIIFNNTDGIINMNLEGGNITVPAVSIPMVYGENLAEAGEGQIYISNESAIIDAPGGGLPSDFSSWGTTSDLFMKPEIAAPGGNIYSSTDPSISGGSYDTWSGTSMAAPHVAGGMVIVSEYVRDTFPELSVAEQQNMVDTILMSTATPVVDADGNLASPRKQGAGLMNLASAVTATSYITVPNNVRPKLELGDDPEMTGVYEMTFTVVNIGDTELVYPVEPVVVMDDLAAIAYGPDAEHPYVYGRTQTSWDIAEYCEIEAPEVVTVPANGSADVTVKITLGDELKEIIDYYYPVGNYIEGFILLSGEDASFGDVNEDGKVDSADAIAVMRYALGLADLENLAAADVNADGNVDMADALLILRYAMNISTDFDLGNSDAGVDLSVPYLAYYGDWNYIPMFDQGFYYDDFSWGSHPDSDNFIGASYGSVAYGLGINPYVETEDMSYYLADRNAISPNDDGFLDTADMLRLGLMRNASEVGYELLDSTGDIIADLAYDEEVRKNWYSTSNSSYSNLGTDVPMPRWNASFYGGEDLAIYIYAYLANDGEVTTNPFTPDTENYFNEWTIPVYVDIDAPIANVASYSNGTLTVEAYDEHYLAYVGAWNGSLVNGEIVLDSNIDEVGLFETSRGVTSQVVLEGVEEGDLVCIADYSGNEVAYVFEDGELEPIAESWSHAGVSVPEVTFYGYTQNLSNSQKWCMFSSTTMEEYPSFDVGAPSDTGNYTAACFTGEYVYGIDENRNLIRYNAEDIDAWTDKTTLGNIASDYSIHELAYNKADGMLYAVSGVGEMKKINPDNGQVVATIDLQYGAVALDFAPDGTCYIIDAFGYFCTMDVATGNQIAEIGTYGVNPVDLNAGSFMPQCGTYRDGYFYWLAIDSSITQYSQVHIIAIKTNTGDFADLGNIWGGLYVLGLFTYVVEVPESTIEPEDFYDNFEGSFDWTTVDADGDGNNWEVKFWQQGLYQDGSKAAVSYSWNEIVLYPDNYMISPVIEIGEGQKYLSYFTSSANTGAGADIDEHWQVIVIPEGLTYADGIVVEETTMTSAKLTEHVVDLSDFAGESVQIAFRHFDCSDEYTLIIDSVAIGSQK